jgi:hypothetical protein
MIYSSNFCLENFSLSKNRTFSQMKYLNLIFPSLFIRRLFESLWSNQHSMLICKLYLNTIFIWLIQPSFVYGCSVVAEVWQWDASTTWIQSYSAYSFLTRHWISYCDRNLILKRRKYSNAIYEKIIQKSFNLGYTNLRRMWPWIISNTWKQSWYVSFLHPLFLSLLDSYKTNIQSIRILEHTIRMNYWFIASIVSFPFSSYLKHKQLI